MSGISQSMCDTVLMERCCLLHHDSGLMHDHTARSAGYFPCKVVLPVMSVCA